MGKEEFTYLDYLDIDSVTAIYTAATEQIDGVEERFEDYKHTVAGFYDAHIGEDQKPDALADYGGMHVDKQTYIADTDAFAEFFEDTRTFKLLLWDAEDFLEHRLDDDQGYLPIKEGDKTGVIRINTLQEELTRYKERLDTTFNDMNRLGRHLQNTPELPEDFRTQWKDEYKDQTAAPEQLFT